MSLHGNLSDFSVLETLQIIGLQGKTGTLEIRSGRHLRELHFSDGFLLDCHATDPADPDPFLQILAGLGLCAEDDSARYRKIAAGAMDDPSVPDSRRLEPQVVHALRHLALQATLEQVLLWQRGEFRFTAREEAPGAAEGERVETALLEAMRRLDEAAELKAAGYALQSVPRRLSEELALPAPEAGADPQETAARLVEEALLRRIDGRRSIGRLASFLYVSEYDALQAVRALEQKDLVRLEAARRPQDPPQLLLEPPRRPRRALTLAGLAALVAITAALGWTLHRTTGSSTWAWQAKAHHQRQAFEDDRAIRTALEILRIRQGRYPDALGSLVESGVWPRRDLGALEEFTYAVASDGQSYRLGREVGSAEESSEGESAPADRRVASGERGAASERIHSAASGRSSHTASQRRAAPPSSKRAASPVGTPEEPAPSARPASSDSVSRP
jgi:hypothetical protein